MKSSLRFVSALTFVVALQASAIQAKNVDLVTLPTRDSVQLTIYNSEDLTLAKETRLVSLKKGANQLQFSWAGTLIDPTSVELRVMAHQDSIDIVDTVYPGQRPQHLIWNIRSEFEGQVPVEVSYFTSGLTWQMDYVAVASTDESALHFRGYVRVYNKSGEEYENAQVRLIVGKINLVEKIQALATLRGIDLGKRDGELLKRLEREVVTAAVDRFEFDGFARSKGKKQIVKEGLSEYFMFSVAGQETIRDGWSKRMQAIEAHDVRLDIAYRMRAYQYGPRPVRFFTWRNDEEHHLGDSPLPNGLVRVFRENAKEGLSYLGQQNLNYVPVKAEIEVNLGVDDLVVFQQRRDATQRMNFDFHPQKNVVVGWDEQQRWLGTIRNYRAEPIRFELRMRLDGDVELTPRHETRAFDFNTIQTEFQVGASQLAEYVYSIKRHLGTNAKQSRVRLVPQP